MQTPANLQEIACQQILDLAEENIVYAELRFAPQYHTKQGLNYNKIIGNTLRGIKKGSKKTGIKANLIICIGRECESAIGCQITKAALSFQDRGVAAIEMAFLPGKEKKQLAKKLIF